MQSGIRSSMHTTSNPEPMVGPGSRTRCRSRFPGGCHQRRRCLRESAQLRLMTFSSSGASDSPTESSNSTCSATKSSVAETSRTHSGTVRENSAIPRGLGDRARTQPDRRPRVWGQGDAAVRVCLCCQVGRFGFAFDSPERTAEISRSVREFEFLIRQVRRFCIRSRFAEQY